MQGCVLVQVDWQMATGAVYPRACVDHYTPAKLALHEKVLPVSTGAVAARACDSHAATRRCGRSPGSTEHPQRSFVVEQLAEAQPWRRISVCASQKWQRRAGHARGEVTMTGRALVRSFVCAPLCLRA
jgi:hypothetical protein